MSVQDLKKAAGGVGVVDCDVPRPPPSGADLMRARQEQLEKEAAWEQKFMEGKVTRYHALRGGVLLPVVETYYSRRLDLVMDVVRKQRDVQVRDAAGNRAFETVITWLKTASQDEELQRKYCSRYQEDALDDVTLQADERTITEESEPEPESAPRRAAKK